jgi:flagellar assembly factor FliW
MINAEDIEGLGAYNAEDFVIYNVAVVREHPEDLTVNLRAPIVINAKNRKGKQVITTDEQYAIRYPLYKAIKSGEGA